MAQQSDQKPDEVRAGPGDAGASDKPDTLPSEPQTKPMDGVSKVVLAVGIAVPVILLIVALFS